MATKLGAAQYDLIPDMIIEGSCTYPEMAVVNNTRHAVQ